MSKNDDKRAVVLALGMFDGVHIGHRALLEKTVSLAEKNGAQPVAYTFINHPQSVFGAVPPMLTTPEEKRDIITSLGLLPVMKPFTKELANLSPQDFISLLSEEFLLQGVVAGYNYHFGRDGNGDPDSLLRLGKQAGLSVNIIEPVNYQGASVSSTRIRQALTDGGLQAANVMLAQPYSFSGVVAPHAGIGKKLGFATANIGVFGKAVPKLGVYATQLYVDRKAYQAVSNIGKRPTVETDGEILLETHILNDAGELYGKNICVRLMNFLREERRFDSHEALCAQMAKDREAAAALHRRLPRAADG